MSWADRRCAAATTLAGPCERTRRSHSQEREPSARGSTPVSLASARQTADKAAVTALGSQGPTHARQLFARLAVASRIDELRACRAAELSLAPRLDDRRT